MASGIAEASARRTAETSCMRSAKALVTHPSLWPSRWMAKSNLSGQPASEVSRPAMKPLYITTLPLMLRSPIYEAGVVQLGGRAAGEIVSDRHEVGRQ